MSAARGEARVHADRHPDRPPPELPSAFGLVRGGDHRLFVMGSGFDHQHENDSVHGGNASAGHQANPGDAGGLPSVPLVEASRTEAVEPKPSWRGWIHAGAFPLAGVLGIILIVSADGAAAKLSSTVFVVTSVLLFGNSALYHRVNWSPRTRQIMRRVDHANIFLLISGSCTPVAVLCLSPAKAVILLSIAWGATAFGIAFRVFWMGAPRWLYVPLYVLVGVSPLIFLGDLFAASPTTTTLILAGGILYIIGAVIYALKQPNPVPGVFGFHEVFHVFTVLAFLCHWAGIAIVALDPAAR
ncbi:hemolysin III family protein [Microbacterium sp. W4I20]|uniref:PAQR family membrane homeostasis protein TrhA n=1 Tax=Microbacterium sp. W4I20 TaxID=3042262 RepID=UPI0027835EEB|nr:hemolysin III family protein [Microbacterium sp. W4I20]MDQ0729073.1 hemolysin III [Microbacterium sp. W4I20]